jgi:hypothetical protein
VAEAFSMLCALVCEPLTLNSMGEYIPPVTSIPSEIRQELDKVHNSAVGHSGLQKLIERLHKPNLKEY